MDMTAIQDLDLTHNWHPCSQMKDYETFKPLVVKRAYDSYIELADGSVLIDAISSWWCKSLGHNHPVLKDALVKQLEKFEHVIFANTTHETIATLSQELAGLLPHLNKVFYAGDGSCAIEVAIKMSLHARQIQGEKQRNRFVALCNGYHGETMGALSVSDLGIYRDPYQSMLFSPLLIAPRYVNSTDDTAWFDANDHWQKTKIQLEEKKAHITAIILEPILQGAGGMRVYSQDFLSKLVTWAKANNIHIIADEIMTGIGRTGKMLACEHANIIPDFLCLSKGLTSGWMPFSAVLTHQKMYDLFYDDYDTRKSFLHSHTYTGNPLGAVLALATLKIIKAEKLCQKAEKLQAKMRYAFATIADDTNMLENIRGIGAVIAADLVNPNQQKRLGFAFYQHAIKQGALLRPLGNTIYWLPPLTISAETLLSLGKITTNAIKAL